MNRVFVAYPREFLCQSKFNRKVDRIVSSLDSYEFTCFEDANQFVQHFSSQCGVSLALEESDSAMRSATHAIVFDDGIVFQELLSSLRERGIPIREIPIKITRVINIRDQPEYESAKNSDSYEYIGRGSYWGNPYSMYEEGETRMDVIRKFEYDFENDRFPKKKKSDVFRLQGKTLGCFCKPEPCHGDVLARFLNSWDDGE